MDKNLKKPLLALGVYDPLSSMIAERAGADFLWLSSYSLCASQGLPDIGALPIPLQEGLISRITAVSKAPLIVDADNAFASERYCGLIADRLAKLGVAGVCIEDKLQPKESSLYPSAQHLQTPEGFCCLLETIRSRAPSLLLLARLEGLAYGESDSTIAMKARLCAEAGANFVVIHNTSSRISRLNRAIERCKGMAEIGLIPTRYMRRLRDIHISAVSLLIFANQLLRANLIHSEKVARALTRTPELAEDIIESVETVNSLILSNV